MNKNHLWQIFSNYIAKFDEINSIKCNENYKWVIAKKFPGLMDEALKQPDESFADALYKAKVVSANLIDSYTQPFYGLYRFSQKEPDTVRRMFLDLYADDGGDIALRQQKIVCFIRRSRTLRDKYYEGSHLYQDDFHSVCGYLFLYKPDENYMYKYTQASIFADCIEFYDDWGFGTDMKLNTFYRMCDEVVKAIKECPELLRTHASRYDGRLRVKSEEMHPDQNYHILTFDLIYCCSVYHLFDGISFTRPKMGEKQLYKANKEKALELAEKLKIAQRDADRLKAAKDYLLNALPVGISVSHNRYGNGTIVSNDGTRIEVDFNNEGIRQLGLAVSLARGFIKADVPGLAAALEQYSDVLKREADIPAALRRANDALMPYEDYLD